MNHQYYLKDKKIDIYEGTPGGTSYGVQRTATYAILYGNVWAYYKQDAGNVSLTTQMTLKAYDATERATFVINRRAALREKTLSMLKVVYNGRVYDIDRIDDFEGYAEDYKLVCTYSSTQSYNGIPATT